MKGLRYRDFNQLPIGEHLISSMALTRDPGRADGHGAWLNLAAETMETIQISGRNLSYIDVGTGPPILFGHSYLWDADMWRPQVDALSGTYRCIVPDLWGHGRSDPVAGSAYSLDRLAEDYTVFVDALGLEHFAVVGLSVGGMWGYRLALNMPERVTKLVLLGTDVGAEPGASHRRFKWMMRIARVRRRLSPAMIDKMMPLFFADATLWDRPDLVLSFQAALEAIPPDRLRGILAVGRGIFDRPDRTDTLCQIRCPTRVIVGAQDRSRPPWEARRLADGIPDADLHILENAGHICNLEAPERVTDLLREFLSDVT